MDTNRKASIQRLGLVALCTNCLLGFVLAMSRNYATYAFTDLAHIPAATMSLCMTIVNVIALFFSLTSGAMISVTRTKWGKYRPWMLGANIAGLLGGFMLFFNLGDSMIFKAVVISTGYLLGNAAMDFIYTARAGLQTAMAGADSDARNLMQSRSWIGGNINIIVSGMVVVPLVRFLGQSNETRGFILAQAIFSILVLIGAIWLVRAGKAYDPDNTAAEHAEAQKISLVEMIKAVIANREAVAVILSDITRFTGYYVLMYLMVYQCTYVIGDMIAMSYVLTGSSIFAILGNLLAPIITPIVGGRKRAIAIFGALTALAFASIGMFGQTLWGFVISTSLAFFFMSFIDTLDSMLYMDAGEIWLHKTGKDTRPYLLSMYNISVKAAMAISSAALGVLLTAIHYEPGMTLDAAGRATLTWSTGLAPAIGYALPLLLMLFHRVPDSDMTTIIKENAEKYGT